MLDSAVERQYADKMCYVHGSCASVLDAGNTATTTTTSVAAAPVGGDSATQHITGHYSMSLLPVALSTFNHPSSGTAVGISGRVWAC